jgi:cytochrome P450
MADEIQSDDLPAYPLPRPDPFAPPPQYAAVRERCPVTRVRIPSGQTAWLVTKHSMVRSLLADGRMSSDRMQPGFPALLPGQQAVDRRGLLPWMDAPEHTQHRRAVINEFTGRRIQALAPRIEEIAEDHITQLLEKDRPADLVEAVSLPVPSLVICELLGVPYADRELFEKRARTVVSHTSAAEDRVAVIKALGGYLSELVAQKQQRPQEDLLSRLAERYREAAIADAHAHLTGMALLLLIAGHETTANMISLSVVSLLGAPDQLAEVQADPSRYPQAVEELLRYWSIADHVTGRVAAADIEVGGELIRGGEGVLLSNAAANHDPEVFGPGDDFDVDRDAHRHLAFGFGIHQCLGQHVARLELQIVLRALFRRIPALRLAVSPEELLFKRDSVIYGLDSLPVTWP